MRIIEEGKAPEIVFNCDICHTKFAEDASKCSLVKGITAYWTTICPTCHQWVKSSEVEN